MPTGRKFVHPEMAALEGREVDALALERVLAVVGGDDIPYEEVRRRLHVVTTGGERLLKRNIARLVGTGHLAREVREDVDRLPVPDGMRHRTMSVRKKRAYYRRTTQQQSRRNPADDQWKGEARRLLRDYKEDILSIMRWIGLKKVTLTVTTETPDIAVAMGSGQVPRVLIGRKWAEADSRQERLKRVIHELKGHVGLGMAHSEESRERGYFSDPDRDQLSWQWYRQWAEWRNSKRSRT